MIGNGSGKMKIWVYAVVLFTSAFIVLLLTALSQIKFNNYVDDIRYQINSEENEKNRFKSNLKSALGENEKLKNDMGSLMENLKNIKSKLDEQSKQSEELRNKYESVISTYKNLLAAQIEYEKGNITTCAEILSKNVNRDDLDIQGQERYDYLAGKTIKKAALELYNAGYKKYRQEKYSSAAESFNKSLIITDKEYYSDDCNFFLAYIAYIQGNKESAKSYANLVISKYPDSNYLKDAKDLLIMLEG